MNWISIQDEMPPMNELIMLWHASDSTVFPDGGYPELREIRSFPNRDNEKDLRDFISDRRITAWLRVAPPA